MVSLPVHRLQTRHPNYWMLSLLLIYLIFAEAQSLLLLETILTIGKMEREDIVVYCVQDFEEGSVLYFQLDLI